MCRRRLARMRPDGASSGRALAPPPHAGRSWDRTRRWGRAVGTRRSHGGKPEGARGGGAGPARPDPQRRARRSRGRRARPALVEALLLGTGAISRLGRVEDGTTVCDHEDVEHRLRPLRLARRGVGAPRGGEGRPSSTPRVTPTSSGRCVRGCGRRMPPSSSSRPWTASTAMTRLLWEECAAVGMPRAVVVTQLDQQRADFDEALAVCQRVFGDGRPAAVPAAARRRGGARGPDRAAVPAGLRLLRAVPGWSGTPTPSTWSSSREPGRG